MDHIYMSCFLHAELLSHSLDLALLFLVYLYRHAVDFIVCVLMKIGAVIRVIGRKGPPRLPRCRLAL